ncbi:hypothetical protein [Sabulicella rubraurantiaca]|uniref:hypothetical protein n=1 Tax=Sabulicella rubraurantiaca TaxID=2811429 RepID=UPI001A9719E5|nr:hypothetical protein [Sabulicella rubraurantiaca]
MNWEKIALYLAVGVLAAYFNQQLRELIRGPNGEQGRTIYRINRFGALLLVAIAMWGVLEATH